MHRIRSVSSSARLAAPRNVHASRRCAHHFSFQNLKPKDGYFSYGHSWRHWSRRYSKTSHRESNKNTNTTQTSSFWSNFLEWYSMKLDTHPITTKCISSGLIAGAGDMICQYMTVTTMATGDLESKVDTNAAAADNPSQRAETSLIDQMSTTKWDWVRTGRFATLGALWVGPVLHVWYGALFRQFPHQVLLRVAIDQFVMAPAFVTSFLSWLWMREGEQTSNLIPRIQENVPSIVVANWALWIPAQTVNFYLMPVKYHVLFSNFVALAWNAYLSYSSRQ